MMTFLGPGIRKKKMESIQAGFWDGLIQHPNRIVTNDTDIGNVMLLQLQQQVAHPGTMHLNTEKIPVGMFLSHLAQCIPIAESNFTDHRRIPTKKGRKIE